MHTVYSEMEDQDLFECFHVRGQDRAFEELMSRHAPPLMRYIQGMLGQDSAQVDDVFQDTWIRMIHNGDKWHGGSFRAWLMTIAHNVVIDLFRRLKPTLSLDAETDSGEKLADSLVSAERLPDALLEGGETEAFIAEQVEALPDAQREVFLMRVVEDMSFKEIAESLGIPLNTALGRMHYAVTRLRTSLESNKGEWQGGVVK